MRIRILLTGAALLIAGCDPVTVPERNGAEVFDFRLPLLPDSAVMRWPSASRIAIYVNPAPEAARTSVLTDAFTQGATAWEAASLYATYSFAAANSPQEADVILTWSDVPAPVVTANCQPSGGAAFTTFCLEGNHLFVYPLTNSQQQSHVRFIVTVRASEAGNATRVRTLVMHELGHVLGLAQHSPNPGDLMFANPLDRSEPNARDRASVQLLYQLQADITP
jgi:predicted Zn-dependent protease